MMRILLVLTCSLSLACLAGAAQPQSDQDTSNPKGKKGQSAQLVQPTKPVVTPKGTSKRSFSTTGTGGTGGTSNTQLPTHYKASKTFQTTGQTQTNLSGQTNVTGKTNLNSSKSNAFRQGTAVTNGSGQTNVSSKTNLNSSKSNAFRQGTATTTFKAQHFNLATNTKPTKFAAVSFQQGVHIQGSQNWQGTQYVVFRNYTPQWHDQIWWTSHHSTIVFVFGGWYFWDAGYWEPCWGYAPNAFYAYDGPIYAGRPEMDPGQVVANVQAALQQQGYYHGDIDGILGPQTRAALADYQVARGIEPTGLVDAPTLESLGIA